MLAAPGDSACRQLARCSSHGGASGDATVQAAAQSRRHEYAQKARSFAGSLVKDCSYGGALRPSAFRVERSRKAEYPLCPHERSAAAYTSPVRDAARPRPTRNVLRAAFKHDEPALAAAFTEIRSNFAQHAAVRDEQEVAALCAAGHDALDFLRTSVVQAKLNERGNFGARSQRDTLLGAALVPARQICGLASDACCSACGRRHEW